ncbi:hypothetical protein T06_5273 [Trichinella sp. T6]|nr:hypothetical protein T06_5273 [Trichinella sp. T6]
MQFTSIALRSILKQQIENVAQKYPDSENTMF